MALIFFCINIFFFYFNFFLKQILEKEKIPGIPPPAGTHASSALMFRTESVQIKHIFVGFEVIEAVVMNVAIFWQ
jgi:hypothetical protein